MPGIVGVVAPGSSGDLEGWIDRMAAPMVRQPWHQVNKKIGMQYGLANVSFGGDEPIAAQDHHVLAFTGEIVGEEDLRARLSQGGDPGAGHVDRSHLLLSLYLQEGEQALWGLNGFYVVVIWDDESKKLTIINDRYGMARLYYWQSKDRLMFASEYKAIVWHPDFDKKVDERGLADLLTAGHMMDDRTLFEEIKVLPHARLAEFQHGDLSIREYWDYDFSPLDGQGRGEADIIDELAHRIRQAVCRRVRPQTAILLTGGMDSRVVAGMYAQCPEGVTPFAYTIGRPGCGDGKYAQEIARKLGIHYTFIPVDASYFEKYAEKSVWLTEGNQNSHGAWIHAGDEYLESHGIDYTMTGLFGNSLSMSAVSEAAFKMNTDEAIYNHIASDRRWRYKHTAQLLKPSIQKNVQDCTLDAIYQTFLRARTDHPVQKNMYYGYTQYERRHGASWDSLGDYARPLDPFFDVDLVDFAIRISPEILKQGRLFKKLQIRHIPKVARVGTVQDGKSVSLSMALERNRWLSKVYHFPIRVRQWVQPSKRARPRLHAYVHPNTWLRTGARDYLLGLMAHKELMEDYLNVDEVDRIVDAHMSGETNDYRIIGAIMTFALWRKLFCGVV